MDRDTIERLALQAEGMADELDAIAAGDGLARVVRQDRGDRAH